MMSPFGDSVAYGRSARYIILSMTLSLDSYSMFDFLMLIFIGLLVVDQFYTFNDSQKA